MLLNKLNKILIYFKYTFLLIFFFQFNVYALNFDNKNHIFLLDFKPQDGSATSSVGEIIYQNNNRIALNVYDANDDFKLIYNTQNLSKPWSTTSNFKFQGLNAADLFNYLYVFDHGLKNVDTSKPYYPKSFQNRTLSTALKLFPGQNNEPAMRKMIEEMLFVIRSKLNYKGKECYLGRESYVFNQNSSRSFSINYLNIDYQIFVKFNNYFYVDIETGLISSKEDGSFRMAGQTEKYTNLLNFNFLKKNCGSQNKQINTKVKNAYINAKSNNSYLAFIKNNNIFDNSSSNNSDTYTASSSLGNLYCQNTTTKRVYETSRSSCVGRDNPISESDYNIILSSQQDDFEIVLKKKPEKHSFHVSTVLNDLETALENNSSPQSEIISAEELLRESKQALATIDNLKALNLLNKIINLNEVPKEILAETYYLLGRVNYVEQNEIEAVKNFGIRHRDFKDIERFKTSNYYWLGRALFAIGDSENGCLVMEDIVFSNEFSKDYSYINDAQLTSKDQNCGSIVSIDSPKSYQVSNDLDDILNNLQGFENKANLNRSSPITSSEIDILRTQLYSCLTLTAGVSNLKDLKPVINIKVNRDRTVRRAVVVNKDRLNEPSFRAAAEAAMRAINNPDCSPLLLPPDKYDQWKEINFTFDFSWMYDDDTYTATNNQVLYVNASSLNVRKSPNGSVILGSFGRNTLLEVLETQLNWTKVRDNSSGLVGWVSNEYLSENLSEFETETIVASNEVENMEEVLPQKQNKEIKLEVKEKENDFDAPDIKCIQDLKTQESFVDINCEIYDKNNLFAVVVDSESISPENKFSHKVQVSIGTSTILVQAYDEYGNVGQFDINVEREFNLAIKEKTLEKLLPGKISVPNKINRLAVVIGIRDYKDISDTKYADKDALTFIDYASNNLGIMPENIKYLIDDSASNFDMEEVNIWLAKKVDKNTEVFLYYSGHGFNNNGEALLLPFDFRTSLIEQSSIKKDKFIQDILLLNPEHIYAFFDACFSGLGREGEALIAGLRNISIVEEKSIDNVTIFNSSSGSEFSSDFDKAGHGLFSYYLMKGLEGDADGNNDQKITTSELYTFIEDNVSKTSGLKQNPSLLSSQDKVILQW